MAQNITIKIAGKDFPLSSSGEDSERVMRLAGEEVDKMLAKYDVKMPDRPLDERMCLVALGLAVGMLQAKSKLADLTAETDALRSDVAAYLSNVTK